MAIYPILRLIYRLLQLKIRPNYDCKLGITRKLAINKRLRAAPPSFRLIHRPQKRWPAPFPDPVEKASTARKSDREAWIFLPSPSRPRPALWATPWEQPVDGGDGAKGADVILSVDSLNSFLRIQSNILGTGGGEGVMSSLLSG